MALVPPNFSGSPRWLWRWPADSTYSSGAGAGWACPQKEQGQRDDSAGLPKKSNAAQTTGQLFFSHLGCGWERVHNFFFFGTTRWCLSDACLKREGDKSIGNQTLLCILVLVLLSCKAASADTEMRQNALPCPGWLSFPCLVWATSPAGTPNTCWPPSLFCLQIWYPRYFFFWVFWVWCNRAPVGRRNVPTIRATGPLSGWSGTHRRWGSQAGTLPYFTINWPPSTTLRSLLLIAVACRLLLPRMSTKNAPTVVERASAGSATTYHIRGLLWWTVV